MVGWCVGAPRRPVPAPSSTTRLPRIHSSALSQSQVAVAVAPGHTQRAVPSTPGRWPRFCATDPPASRASAGWSNATVASVRSMSRMRGGGGTRRAPPPSTRRARGRVVVRGCGNHDTGDDESPAADDDAELSNGSRFRDTSRFCLGPHTPLSFTRDRHLVFAVLFAAQASRARRLRVAPDLPRARAARPRPRVSLGRSPPRPRSSSRCVSRARAAPRPGHPRRL